MAKTVVGLFDDFTQVQQVIRDLQNKGFSCDDISIVANDAKGEYGKFVKTEGTKTTEMSEGAAGGAGVGAAMGGIAGLLVGLGALAIPGIGPVIAAGPLATTLAGAGIGAVTGGLLGALVNAGLPEEQAHAYAEGVRRGGTLLIVKTSDEMAKNASDIMNRHGAVDVERRTSDWRKTTDWNRFDEKSKPYSSEEIQTERTRYTSYAGGTGTGETYRSNTMREGMGTGDMESFDTFDRDFRKHYDTTFSNRGYTYDQVRPAYKYGYEVRNDKRFMGRDWNQIEPELRRDWEMKHPDNAWEEFKDAVRMGWQELTGRR